MPPPLPFVIGLTMPFTLEKLPSRFWTSYRYMYVPVKFNVNAPSDRVGMRHMPVKSKPLTCVSPRFVFVWLILRTCPGQPGHDASGAARVTNPEKPGLERMNCGGMPKIMEFDISTSE